MIALRDIEEHTVDKEEERLNVQVLTPRQAQVEEELCQALVVNALAIELCSLALLSHLLALSPFLKACLLFFIHEALILLVELLTALLTLTVITIVVLILVVLIDPLKTILGCLLLLLTFTLQVNLPVLFSRLTSRVFIEI